MNDLKALNCDFSSDESVVSSLDLKKLIVEWVKIIELKIAWMEYKESCCGEKKINKPNDPEPKLPFNHFDVNSLLTVLSAFSTLHNLTEEDVNENN